MLNAVLPAEEVLLLSAAQNAHIPAMKVSLRTDALNVVIPLILMIGRVSLRLNQGKCLKKTVRCRSGFIC